MKKITKEEFLAFIKKIKEKREAKLKLMHEESIKNTEQN